MLILKLKHPAALITVCVLLGLSVSAAALSYFGIIRLNNPSSSKYPVRGVDVSSFQGEIDFNLLSKNNINFAYIKATEGSTYKDTKFSENFKNSKKTELCAGAYHFMSFDSSGAAQSANFISAVGKDCGKLPPAVDVELYGKYKKSPPERKETAKILKELLSNLESYYSRKPVIYCTENSYNLYIKDEFDGYPLWIRNVFTRPILKKNKQWTFWQYSDRGVLSGYKGKEKYIDLNVFYSDKSDFENFLLNNH